MVKLHPLFIALLALSLPSVSACAGSSSIPVAAAPAVVEQRGIVSSADPRGSEAGAEILRAGGSASDAAIAMMLALTVVEPQSSGIGGGGFMVHRTPTGDLATIDGRETAPMSATPALFLEQDGTPMGFRAAVPGGRSAGVPGNIALAARAHQRWGKLPWARLFEPAIRLARDGFVVNDVLASRLKYLASVWVDFPETQAIYWRDGKPVEAGTRLTNPALANLLEAVAKRGPEAFYSGQNAQAIVDAISKAPRNPVPMTLEDVSRYRAKDRPPVCGTYRDFKICGMGPPSSGAITVLQILKMVERFDLKALGKDNPRAWHLIGEAMRLAYADRNTYLADSDFVDVPVSGMIDPTYLAARSALINPERALGEYRAGQPNGARAFKTAEPGEVPATTHFVAVDRSGAIASMTSTIEGPFGNQMVVNGYFLNNELTDFSFEPEEDGKPVVNRVEGGKRPLSSMSPTIVMDASGRPVFTVGAAGGKTIIMQVAKAIIARIDWELSARESIGLGLIYFDRGGLVLERGTTLEPMKAALETMGHRVSVGPLGLKANAAALEGDRWEGAADPRSPGTAITE